MRLAIGAQPCSLSTGLEGALGLAGGLKAPPHLAEDVREERRP
jgi:hypothetical protein